MENKTILVVEDEKIQNDALKFKLTKEGFSVITAFDGEEGIEKALSQKPDLILLDLIMPNMDGLSMLKLLREDVWGANVPVVVLTNLIAAEKLDELKKNNISDFLEKSENNLDNIVKVIKEKTADKN